MRSLLIWAISLLGSRCSPFEMTPADAQRALMLVGVEVRYAENRGYFAQPAGEPVVHKTFPVLLLAFDDGRRGEIDFDDHDRMESITLVSAPMEATKAARVQARPALWTSTRVRHVVFVAEDEHGLSTVTERYVAIRP